MHDDSSMLSIPHLLLLLSMGIYLSARMRPYLEGSKPALVGEPNHLLPLYASLGISESKVNHTRLVQVTFTEVRQSTIFEQILRGCLHGFSGNHRPLLKPIFQNVNTHGQPQLHNSTRRMLLVIPSIVTRVGCVKYGAFR